MDIKLGFGFLIWDKPNAEKSALQAVEFDVQFA